MILFKPPFGSKRLDIIPPNLRIPVDGVTGYTQNRTLREEFPRNVHPALGNDTRKTQSDEGLQSKGLVNDSFQVRKPLDDFRGCDWVIVVSESLVEFVL